MNKILVTGTGRSGTTVLGRILNYAPKTNFLMEPFNRHVWMHVPDYQAYIGENSLGIKKAEYERMIQNVLHVKNLVPWPRDSGTSALMTLAIKMGIRRITIQTAIARAKLQWLKPEHTIFKDPAASSLARHLVENHDFKVVYTVRHPAALYLGRKELGWRFNPESYERQPDLIESFGSLWDGLAPLKQGGILEQSILLWMTCYYPLLELEKCHPGKVFRLRHEDWCIEPMHHIEDVYRWLGLQYTKKVKRKVISITSGRGSKRKASSLAKVEPRNSRDLAFKWKKTIDPQEFKFICEKTEPLLSEFYPEEDFNTL